MARLLLPTQNSLHLFIVCIVIKIQAIDQVIYDVPCLQKKIGTYSFLTVLWLASQKDTHTGLEPNLNL